VTAAPSPGNACPGAQLAALMEEVGELAQAIIQGQPRKAILAEAVQVAVMAQRIATEGDRTLGFYP